MQALEPEVEVEAQFFNHSAVNQDTVGRAVSGRTGVEEVEHGLEDQRVYRDVSGDLE